MEIISGIVVKVAGIRRKPASLPMVIKLTCLSSGQSARYRYIVLLRGRRLDSGVWLSFFLRTLFNLTRMSDDAIDNADSEQPLGDAPHHVWQF